jgi:16S rRNA (guanine527-N7)-methyltransferase
MSQWQPLQDWAAAQERPLSAEQLAQFDRYLQLLVRWSERMNLTAIRDPEAIIIRHFLDSLTCAQVTGDLNGHTLIDVGTGAGFPGLPLKILYPDLALTLTDSVAKKTHFLQAVVDDLGLTGITILAARAEDLGQDADHRQHYDWAVARSVAELRTLAEYLLPLVRVGGHALAQKGAYAEEVAAAQEAIAALGGRLGRIETVQLPNTEQPHALIVLDKLTDTDSRYPRRAGVPSKRPL